MVTFTANGTSERYNFGNFGEALNVDPPAAAPPEVAYSSPIASVIPGKGKSAVPIRSVDTR